MEIKYQKKLQAYPNAYREDGSVRATIEPMTEEEVEAFELYCVNKFNITVPNYKFPLAYREYLLLAGKRCYVYSTGSTGIQTELQRSLDFILELRDTEIPVPYCVIDTSGDSYPIVKLLDISDDPILYECLVAFEPGSPVELVSIGRFSEFTNNRVQMVQDGKLIF